MGIDYLKLCTYTVESMPLEGKIRGIFFTMLPVLLYF
jgi:hypothetical protein